jgi:hypothetical protein
MHVSSAESVQLARSLKNCKDVSSDSGKGATEEDSNCDAEGEPDPDAPSSPVTPPMATKTSAKSKSASNTHSSPLTPPAAGKKGKSSPPLSLMHYSIVYGQS